ncbi:4'-phosphopantetheinyl transferase family protein [Sphingomonas immobilis]|uniref:4'-phosphopantetheinyl transferase superfamily protein n=1 Tax=Sphingomonas immobilis TaxID=3063997 RepID=A0ABT9A213_9SPHN|nr:4'-phosphopantetheinyl transferase superfamily protein [Sphingomonas sp. CA1-15]MDO7843036.1 4'-phosphopantetheinyl transferase superfamily protein [Sphingomonas sp. CA1-15]
MAHAEVFHGSLDVGEAEVARLTHLLSVEERERAARFHFARDRRRFVVRRARLREVLGTATAERLVYTENVYGKPRLSNNAVRFSATHSGDTWAIAISSVEVGLDIEAHDTAVDWRDLAAGLFGANEIAALHALPEAEARHAFFDVWARKEAFVKAIGMGLSYPLDAFEVSAGHDARLIAGADGWAITRLDLSANYGAALVLADDGSPVDVTLRAALVAA